MSESNLFSKVSYVKWCRLRLYRRNAAHVLVEWVASTTKELHRNVH